MKINRDLLPGLITSGGSLRCAVQSCGITHREHLIPCQASSLMSRQSSASATETHFHLMEPQFHLMVSPASLKHLNGHSLHFKRSLACLLSSREDSINLSILWAIVGGEG